MSYDEFDAMEDAAMDAMYEQVTSDPAVKQQFYEELYEEIVKDFTGNRLLAFYEREPEVALPAVRALERARHYLPLDDTTAFIFAGIAAEVGIKSALFKPIVFGLVHSDAAAALMMDMLPLKNNFDQNVTSILVKLLRDYGQVDLHTHKRGGVATTLWQEIASERPLRNGVIHQGKEASHADAELAVNIAAAILEEIFPTLVTNLGLHLHGSRVCGSQHRTPTGSQPT